MTPRHLPAVLLAIALAAGATTACQGPGVVDSLTGWADTGLHLPVGIPATDLPDRGSDGARLVASYCSQCHGIPSPASHSADDWVPTLRRMVQRMGQSSMMMPGGGMMHRMPMGMHGARVPTADGARTILAYLQHHALVAVAGTDVPEAGTPAADLFAATCTRCHALPSPAQHLRSEWPTVVARMQQHTRELNVPPIADADAAAIVTYLQQHAGTSGSAAPGVVDP